MCLSTLGNFFFFFFFFLEDLKILFKSESQRERGRDRDLHPLDLFPSGRFCQSWVALKPGARSSLQVSHTGARAQGLWPSPLHSQGISRELGQKCGSWDSYQRHVGCRWHRQSHHSDPTSRNFLDWKILRLWLYPN